MPHIVCVCVLCLHAELRKPDKTGKCSRIHLNCTTLDVNAARFSFFRGPHYIWTSRCGNTQAGSLFTTCQRTISALKRHDFSWLASLLHGGRAKSKQGNISTFTLGLVKTVSRLWMCRVTLWNGLVMMESWVQARLPSTSSLLTHSPLRDVLLWHQRLALLLSLCWTPLLISFFLLHLSVLSSTHLSLVCSSKGLSNGRLFRRYTRKYRRYLPSILSALPLAQ